MSYAVIRQGSPWNLTPALSQTPEQWGSECLALADSADYIARNRLGGLPERTKVCPDSAAHASNLSLLAKRDVL